MADVRTPCCNSSQGGLPPRKEAEGVGSIGINLFVFADGNPPGSLWSSGPFLTQTHARADLPAPSAASLALISPIRRCKTTKLRSNEPKTSTQNMKQIDPTPQNFSARTRRSLALRRPMKHFLTNQLVPSRAL